MSDDNKHVAGLEIGDSVYVNDAELTISSIQFGGAHDVNVALHTKDERASLGGDWDKLRSAFDLELPHEREPYTQTEVNEVDVEADSSGLQETLPASKADIEDVLDALEEIKDAVKST